MKGWLRYFGALIAFWLLLFLLERSLFLASGHRLLAGVETSLIALCQLRALPMDVSTTGYILLVCSAILLPLLFTGSHVLRISARIFLQLIVFVSAVICVVDCALFDAWGSRIDHKALAYLAWPGQVIGVLSFGQVIGALAMITAIFLLGRWGLKRIERPAPFTGGPLPARIATAVITPAFCLLMARGGPQELPIDKSWSFFSRHSVLNLAALNGVWNVMDLVIEPEELTTNPYQRMRSDEAESLFAASHVHDTAGPVSILNVQRPNVLLILLESWTADVIAPLGGERDVTPRFTQLCAEGTLFTHFYSTGFRTEQGLCALISGFPAQPTTTIMRNFGKFDRLPSLAAELRDHGYSSTYWYAGDPSFANTRTYLRSMGFDRVHDDRSFPIHRRTKWGAFDEELFAFHLREVPSRKRPFFDVLMTSTSHEPFTAEVNEGFSGSEEQRYRNTVHYTDRCLGDFMAHAREQPWYDSTLIIICADHGHSLPLHTRAWSAALHHIPFLITGGALRPEMRGTTNNTFACHSDLAATLLAQFGLPYDRFDQSRDLFDRTVPHRAFWTFNDGFGIADSTQAVAFDEASQRVIELRDSSAATDEERLLREGQAHLQVLMDRYIGFDQ